jgi:uncharacterized Zn finger protein
MSRYDYYDYYKPSRPIETDQGLKAKSKRGAFVKNWWATRWIKALERLVDAGRLRRGRTYARKGQVLSLEETKGGISAKVQGSRQRPYKVTIDVGPLSNAQWDQVLDVLAGQAIFAAQLLASEMPQEIEEAFQAAGVSLFPGNQAELITNCSCPDWANPCKHVAAVHYILGEQFDEDPFLLFRLRGRTQEQILGALRARRAEAVGSEDDTDELADTVTPLAETIEHFWDMAEPLIQLKTTIKLPVTEFPVLKRLGQPNFLSDDLLKTLGPAYQAITEAAIETAFGQETENEETEAQA